MTQLKQINFKITPEQYDALTTLAGDTPLYAYIREVVVNHLEENGIPRQEISPRGGKNNEGVPVQKIQKLEELLKERGKEGSIVWEVPIGEDKYHYVWIMPDGKRIPLGRGYVNASRSIG